MSRSKLAQLRQADERHHIHPYTDNATLQAHGTHLIESADAFRFDPREELTNRPGVSRSGVVVVDVGDEEFEEALLGLRPVDIDHSQAGLDSH